MTKEQLIAQCLKCGIPQDIIDQANKIGMDLEDLMRLCVQHTIDSARSWLGWCCSKLPKV